MLFKKKSKKIPGGEVFTVDKKWPCDGDIYFWVRSDIGMICKSVWSDDGPYHEFRRATGNCFRTRTEALNAIDEVKTYTLWKERPE